MSQVIDLACEVHRIVMGLVWGLVEDIRGATVVEGYQDEVVVVVVVVDMSPVRALALHHSCLLR